MKTIACLLCAILYLLGSTSVCLADDAPLDIYDEEVSIDNYSEEGFVEESSMMYVCASPYVRLRQTDSTDLPYPISEDHEKLIDLFLDHKGYGPNTRDDVVWVVRRYLHYFETLG